MRVPLMMSRTFWMSSVFSAMALTFVEAVNAHQTVGSATAMWRRLSVYLLVTVRTRELAGSGIHAVVSSTAPNDPAVGDMMSDDTDTDIQAGRDA